MKLYSDEEANYLCRDYRDIPFELRQMLFDKILDDNHISQFNPSGKKKRDYSTPANINLFSEAVGNNYGIDSTIYRKQYNKMYDKNVKNKYNKLMEDRKRDDDLAKYENILAMLRNPKGEFKIVGLPDLMGAYSDAIVTDATGMLMDIDKMERDINEMQGEDARREVDEIQTYVGELLNDVIEGAMVNSERKERKGVDTSIVGVPNKASQSQFTRRRRERETRETIVAGVEESKNEEYQI